MAEPRRSDGRRAETDEALARASDPQTPPGELAALCTTTDRRVLAAVAGNPNTPVAMLLSLITQFPGEILSNPALPLLFFERPALLKGAPSSAAAALMANSATPAWLVPLICEAWGEDKFRLLSFAPSASTPPAVLAGLVELAGPWRPVLRCAVAQNPALPAELAGRLARDELPEVRAALAASLDPQGASSRAVLETLARDDHPAPRLLAGARLEPPRGCAAPEARARAGGASSLGRRNHNEDAFGVLTVPGGLVAVVADGMGGHSTGAAASLAVVKSLRDTLGLMLAQARPADLSACLSTSLALAHVAVCCAEARYRGGIGSTVACLLLSGDSVHVGHVGDSRVYRLRHGAMEQLTEDHSLLNELLRSGQLLPEQAEAFPHRNVITRAMGISLEQVKPEFWQAPLAPGDVFLLCSDGLLEALPLERVAELALASDDPAASAKALTSAADQAGATDNITAVLVAAGGSLSETLAL